MRENELIYAYRLPPDGSKSLRKTDRLCKGGGMHVIHVTDDLNEVFRFCGLDRERYEAGFKSWFDYVSWLFNNCKYMTRIVINSLQNGVESNSDSLKTDEELFFDLKKFLLYVRLSHEEIRDNDRFPALLYYNIKEDIVRNFFFDEELEERFINIKRKHLFKNELEGKFNSEKLVRWIPALKDNTELLNLFGKAFITFMTEGKVERFPKYLLDSEYADIRRDALSFYEDIFEQSDEYKIQVVEGKDKGWVL
jgi:hypothetical protein